MRFLLGIVLLAGLGLGVYYWRASSTKDQYLQNTPQVVQVKRGPLQVTIESIGTIAPEREVEIKCEASGEIIKLPVDVSDIVKAGDLLVQLDPRDANLLVRRAQVASSISKAKLNQAKLTLEIAQQDFANARNSSMATLASAEVLVRETIAQLKRIEELHEKKITSIKELQSAQTTHAQAIAGLEAAKISFKALDTWEPRINSLRQDICISEQNVLASKIDLDDAQESLRETTVQSPINGVVTARDVQVGQIISSGTSNVSGGTTVLYLADMRKMYVHVSVDESDIGRIRKGQGVKVTVDAFPSKEFQGTVVRVATKGLTSSNVVTFQVKVEITCQEKTLLKPGMTANVEILIADKKDTLLVASKVIQQTSQSCSVTILNANKTTSKRKVTIGETNGETTEILSGLHEGDKVVVTQRDQSRWRNQGNQSQQNMSNSLLGANAGNPGMSAGAPQ